MKQSIFRVTSNAQIARSVYKMTVTGDTSAITAPGQFVNIKLSGFFLRRPISVCDMDSDRLTLIYKTVGHGTEAMASLPCGAELDMLTGLGNGYDLSLSGEAPLLVGGGAGVPPLYYLAKKIAATGKRPSVILGFQSGCDVFFEKEFKKLGADVYVTTADGTHGEMGFVTDVMKRLDYSYFYACGPEKMFCAMEKVATSRGEYSFEERMGCGFGACMGCSCKTIAGSKRICRDGPVMKREEIIWDD